MAAAKNCTPNEAQSYTPMVQQYLAVKEQHKNELLFFRLGDFYEMFFEDALTASRELNITLTKRAGSGDNIPMCGVPYHSVDGYIAKLVQKGYRIAICEQMEDPRFAKGIVERKVIKIITPGTAMNEQVLEDKHNRYLVLLHEEQQELCMAVADVSTGECRWFKAIGQDKLLEIEEQLYRLQPAELVLTNVLTEQEQLLEWLRSRLPECTLTNYAEEASDSDSEVNYFAQHFASTSVAGAATTADTASTAPVASINLLVQHTVELLLRYLHGTVMADLSHINQLSEIVRDSFMQLDATAIRNLELVRSMADGSKRGTLLGVLDFTKTSMGARRLRSWIETPLLDIARIHERQEAVAELLAKASLRDAVAEQLKAVADLERIVSRVEVGSANARDLVALRSSLTVLPGLKDVLQGCQSKALQRLNSAIGQHSQLAARLAKAIVDEPPFSIREGGMIRPGYNAELDELQLIAADNKSWMQNFELKIKEATGIKTMKVGFNKVFGYYIEVSKGQANSVPDYFVRKQTLVNAERFIVPELKEYENKILGAKEKIQSLEFYLFDELRTLIRGQITEIQATARAIGTLDVLNGLALAAYKYNYVRPELNNQGEIRITDGRHPVVERLLEKEIFVPNNVNLNNTDERMIIITGPNMAGKSTYMRQVAL
ncbi:MAG: DNA mismatch repair protein MutS, partial [Phascolarctobacterium sp.]